MIFVTVGTHIKSFERLIKKMDEIAGTIDEEVIMQIGFTKYHPKNAKYFDFMDDENKFNELYKNARIVICHAGAGTILDALKYARPTIVVPRMAKYDEHNDDQQLELAEVLSNNNKVIAVYNIDDLEDAIQRVGKLEFRESEKNSRLVNFLKEYKQNLLK
jgi:beta-1,4-N-acetylglucosaminyltransferase